MATLTDETIELITDKEFLEFIQDFDHQIYSKFSYLNIDTSYLDSYLSDEISQKLLNELLLMYDSEKKHLTSSRLKSLMQEVINQNIFFFLDPKNTLYIKFKILEARVNRRLKGKIDLSWLTNPVLPERKDQAQAEERYSKEYLFSRLSKEYIDRSRQLELYKMALLYYEELAEYAEEKPTIREKSYICVNSLRKGIFHALTNINSMFANERFQAFS